MSKLKNTISLSVSIIPRAFQAVNGVTCDNSSQREAIQKNKEYQKGKVPNLLGPPPYPLIRKKNQEIFFSHLDLLPPPKNMEI